MKNEDTTNHIPAFCKDMAFIVRIEMLIRVGLQRRELQQREFRQGLRR